MKKGLLTMIVTEDWMIEAANRLLTEDTRYTNTPKAIAVKTRKGGKFHIAFEQPEPTQPPPPKQEE